jgi:ribosomal protein S12 methylthiotransferase accessory factor
MTRRKAVAAAILEMCLLELAHHVVEVKRQQRGEAAPNDRDRGHLRRNAFDANHCLLLDPPSPIGASEEADVDDSEALRIVVDRLAALQVEAYAIELTRPEFTIPVVRVIAPGPQLEPCELTSGRLARTIARTGGGDAYTGGVALI